MHGQEIVDVGIVLCGDKATLAVGVQDPRRSDLDPQVVGMSGIVQRVQRLAGAMGRDRHKELLLRWSMAGPTISWPASQPT
jgi:hypothetical protein